MWPAMVRLTDADLLLCWILCRVRLRSDGAAIPRRRSGGDTHSPPRGMGPGIDTPPRAAACPSSPHKIPLNRGRIESPEKRRMATFGSAGSINFPDRKALADSHPLRSTCGSTRHSSLGDQKSLEAEALAEVRGLGKDQEAEGELTRECPEPLHLRPCYGAAVTAVTHLCWVVLVKDAHPADVNFHLEACGAAGLGSPEASLWKNIFTHHLSSLIE